MLLSCGDALVDFLPVTSVDGRDAAVPVAGGSCLNIAVGMARLGAPAGFVGVHFPPLNRKPFASETPTPEEARAALQGYIAYYGALGVYPGEVFHNILAGLSPAQGTILRRFADIEGDELTVRLQPGRNQQGQEATNATIVILKRLSGVDDMLPK